MQYQFDDVSASIIIDAINSIPVIEASSTSTTFSKTSTYLEVLQGKSSNVLEVSLCSFTGRRYMTYDGLHMFDLKRFGWSNRRRIFKAIDEKVKVFQNSERADNQKRADSLNIENLNALIAKLKG